MGNLVSTEKQATIINCPVHETPYNGICGNKLCYECGLICTKCNHVTCILNDGHELISVDEFYLRFFAMASGSVDFKKLDYLVGDLRNIDRDRLTKQIEQYNLFACNLIDDKLKHLHADMNGRLDSLKKHISFRLEKLHKDYLEAESRIDLSSFEVPENFSLEETKKFFEKNSKSVRDMENMINLVKKYSDNEKLQMNQKDMETIIFSKNLINQNLKELVEEKLEIILKDLKSDLEELVTMLNYQKESSSIFFTGLKKFSHNPCELKYKQDISTQCQKSYTIDSVFTAFTTVDGNSYVAWANPSHAIDIFELKSNKIFKSLTGHTQHVFIVRHFYHSKASTDYLITTAYEKNCKIWNANSFDLVVTLTNCHTGSYLYSAMILFDDTNSKAYAVSTAPNEFSKVWDIPTGTFVRNIGTTTDYTYYINTWYDTKNNEIYIINANSADVKIYEYKTGTLYKAFKSESSTWHMSALIHVIKDTPYLFETDGNGYLRVWNVHTGVNFKTIQCSGVNLRGLCLWNDQYIIAASSDKAFKVFDIFTFELTATISGHDNVVCSVDKVIHPIFGEVLISSAIDGKIKLWVIENQ